MSDCMPFILRPLYNRTGTQLNVEYIAAAYKYIHNILFRFVDPFTLDFHTDTRLYAWLWEGGKNKLLDKLQQPNPIKINIICKQYVRNSYMVLKQPAHITYNAITALTICKRTVCAIAERFSIRLATFNSHQRFQFYFSVRCSSFLLIPICFVFENRRTKMDQSIYVIRNTCNTRFVKSNQYFAWFRQIKVQVTHFIER